MKNIAIVTDSTAVIPDEIKQHPRLYILPIPVIIDGEPKTDSDINPKDFYSRLKKEKNLPTTSQPSLGEALALYQQIARDGYDAVISIHLSSGISGFINHLTSFAPTIEEIEVYPFDSLLTSAPMLDMVTMALKAADNNDDVDHILAKLEDMRDNQRALLVVDDLHHLVRGGRLSNGAALIGSLLNIKPILHFHEGKIEVLEKVRSSKKAYARCIEFIKEHDRYLNGQSNITIVHTAYEEKAIELAQKLEKDLGKSIHVNDLGVVVGTHTGEKAIGFAITKKV